MSPELSEWIILIESNSWRQANSSSFRPGEILYQETFLEKPEKILRTNFFLLKYLKHHKRPQFSCKVTPFPEQTWPVVTGVYRAGWFQVSVSTRCLSVRMCGFEMSNCDIIIKFRWVLARRTLLRALLRDTSDDVRVRMLISLIYCPSLTKVFHTYR